MKPAAILQKLYKSDIFLFALWTRYIKKHKDPYNRVMFDLVPLTMRRARSSTNAAILVEQIRKYDTCYSWYTFIYRGKYYAAGPSIEKQVVALFDMTGTDAVKFFEKGAIVTCNTYKPNLKGGHRQNALHNAEFRKTFRSKQVRKIAQFAINYEQNDSSKAYSKLTKRLSLNDKIHYHTIKKVAQYAVI